MLLWIAAKQIGIVYNAHMPGTPADYDSPYQRKIRIVAARRGYVYELRNQGMSIEDIATKLGISVSVAHNDYNIAWSERSG